jgi:hypothetical protein
MFNGCSEMMDHLSQRQIVLIFKLFDHLQRFRPITKRCDNERVRDGSILVSTAVMADETELRSRDI